MSTRGPGHPTKAEPVLTLACIDAFCAAYKRKNATFQDACLAAKIAERTGHKWHKRGEEDLEAGESGSLHAQFYLRFEKTRNARIRRLIGVALDPDAKAAAASARFMLERIAPKAWHLAQKQEHSGPEGKPLEVNATARVVVLPPIADERALSDGAVGADAEASALSREPRE